MIVLNMNCVEGMRAFPDNHFDSIVTDPPYELGFMGKSWDASGIAYSVEMWREALRVLKPGGHLLAFSGSRTYHRMTCAIEDAGFEVRDQIMWVYGSGFPKSLDVSKAIDKAAGYWRGRAGEVQSENGAMSGGNYERTPKGDPITAAAAAWQGWGTALKPAHEPICVARKPLIGTVAANVLAHGTGAINVDGCRVKLGAGEQPYSYPNGRGGEGWHGRESLGSNLDIPSFGNDLGRWPANLIHDGSDEVLAAFPQASGQQGDLNGQSKDRKSKGIFGDMPAARHHTARVELDKSAARFFYCAKASKSDRNEGLESFTPATTSDGRTVAADNAYQRGKTERANTHPTVKPTDLMRYLCRLVTPPGGIVMDPFTGSGSTGKAAVLEGFSFIGFKLSAEYTAIATTRISRAIDAMGH